MDIGNTDGRDKVLQIFDLFPVEVLTFVVVPGLMTLGYSSDIMISSEE
jgi:hypothetical protein